MLRFNNLRGLYFKNNEDTVILKNCRSIHTLFFSKNIDVAFVSRNKRVIKAVRNLRPWSFSSCKDAYYVIERFSDTSKSWYKEGEMITEEVKDESLSGM